MLCVLVFVCTCVYNLCMCVPVTMCKSACVFMLPVCMVCLCTVQLACVPIIYA